LLREKDLVADYEQKMDSLKRELERKYTRQVESCRQELQLKCQEAQEMHSECVNLREANATLQRQVDSYRTHEEELRQREHHVEERKQQVEERLKDVEERLRTIEDKERDIQERERRHLYVCGEARLGVVAKPCPSIGNSPIMRVM
jgi:chromosome segregation ATPase